MTIVVDPGSFTDLWIEELRRHLPGERFVTRDDAYDPSDVEFLVNWMHETERILTYSNMKAIVLASAGYDHLALAVRDRFPVVRLIDPAMAHDIALYCISWVIHFQRDFDRSAANQMRREWRKPSQRFPRDYTVGVLGRGQIGSVVLAQIAELGFATIGWSRSNNDRPLDRFFADCDVVINLLPNTPDTQGLISAELLAALDDGVLINVGRGPTVDSAALLKAADDSLRAAVLDVFDTEPLPADDPLWRHPRITVTPHIAGRTDPFTAAAVVADNIRALRAGQTPAGLI